MSEAIDLQAASLCITEDAFEEFQAQSMYEEEKLITLEDIVPASEHPPLQLHVPNFEDINEIPYDNEVVLTSNYEDPNVNISQEQQVSNSNTGSTSNGNKLSQVAKKRGRKMKVLPENSLNKSENVNNVLKPSEFSLECSGSTNYDNELLQVPKKRGRKIKVPPEISLDKSENVNNVIELLEFSLEDNSASQSQNSRPKRGRKPKSRYSDGDYIDNSFEDNKLNELETCDNLRTDTSAKRKGRPRKKVVEDNVYVPTTTPQRTPGKRGRKKQNTVCLPSPSSNASNQIHNGNNLTPSKNECLQEDLEDVKLSKLKSKEENTIPLPNSDTDIQYESGSQSKSLENTNIKKLKTSIPKKKVPLKTSLDNSIFDDEADDICLSKLKEVKVNPEEVSSKTENIENVPDTTKNNIEECLQKTILDSPPMTDFEKNIDSIVVQNIQDNKIDAIQDDADNSLLVESTLKRPRRRKKPLQYDESSDEDPFANIELSEDEDEVPRKRKKSGKYYSDDEYVPGSKHGANTPESTETEIDDDIDDLIRQNRKKSQSPKKRGRKSLKEKETEIITASNLSQTKATMKDPDNGDIEACLEPAVIGNSSTSKPSSWSMAHEFENFLAKKIQNTNLKIKKVRPTQKTEKPAIVPLEIPVIDTTASKEPIEKEVQTVSVETTSTSVQTSAVYDIPMKKNVVLTPDQAEKACEFMCSVVKTTSELGQLMTEKSQDFIKKKINTEHVTDTFKMDYCVRKSFLLFKLAKHNLLQMEEDLAKQYEMFLKSNDLASCREEPKVIPVKPKEDSDSDCEIVEVDSKPNKKPETKPKFNPKTVFLNKELSIKIAKKTSEEKKVNIKGRHTVWINDSVMVKKVKPTQSFLAQDSRNKKPPDNYITEKMVSDFFENHYKKNAQTVCAPYTSVQWHSMNRCFTCCYFVVSSTEVIGDETFPIASSSANNTEYIALKATTSPKTLFTLCTELLSNYLKGSRSKNLKTRSCNEPSTLFRLCIDDVNNTHKHGKNTLPAPATEKDNEAPILSSAISLSSLCLKRVLGLISNDDLSNTHWNEIGEHNNEELDYTEIDSTKSIEELNITISDFRDGDETYDNGMLHTVLPLKEISLRKIKDLMSTYYYSNEDFTEIESLLHIQDSDSMSLNSLGEVCVLDINKNKAKSLFALCVESIQIIQKKTFHDLQLDTMHNAIEPASLKEITLNKVLVLMLKTPSHYNNVTENDTTRYLSDNFEINCINTLSEEAFLNLNTTDLPVNSADLEVDDGHYDDEFDTSYNDTEENNQLEESNWVSQVQKELRSFSNLNNDNEEEVASNLMVNIKVEPLDEDLNNIVDHSIVKTEPGQGLDQMTVIPEHIVTKSEIMDELVINTGSIERHDSSSYEADEFEHFVRSNKMMHALDETEDEIFSQSASRVRRQHEPDFDPVSDANMLNSLLIPQAFEPIHAEKAKGHLMESSSDEDKQSKKATLKKKRGRPKKDSKTNNKEIPKANNKEVPNINNKDVPNINNKEVPNTNNKEVSNTNNKEVSNTNNKEVSNTSNKEVPNTNIKEKSLNELAILTRRMREKIREEAKKIDSSESDIENQPHSLRKEKSKKVHNEKISKNKNNNDVIQCNSVDSTEDVKTAKNATSSPVNFSGFTAVDQNEISTYQKYMKYVYDKIIPRENESKTIISPKIELDETNFVNDIANEPVELIECEPTLPIMDDDEQTNCKKKRVSIKKTRIKNAEKELINETTKPKRSIISEPDKTVDFVLRNNWNCYPIDANDIKLHQNVKICLEKLPESFVQTYFMYQDITDKDHVDADVDRLINLQSLKRYVSIVKDNKSRFNKNKPSKGVKKVVGSENLNCEAMFPDHNTGVDHYNELTPSEDEADVDDGLPPELPLQSSDNCIAKNALMDESGSDGERGKTVDESPEVKFKTKPGPKSKTEKFHPTVESGFGIMLTADKSMNKELNMLHAPILMNEDVKYTPKKEPSPRDSKAKRTASKKEQKYRIKNEEDSSSEEEKQWVSTKEKLLKRMVKKEETTVDDAKRTKLVNEFIERRGVAPEAMHRRSNKGKRRMSNKTRLERAKQLRVLSRELFGENYAKRSTSYSKGRRNIRKVIDKKSLTSSTVMANMEEFERKRRLNMIQNKLREVLGCEEGVNVLVINDELCLEYDFEEQRPVVTVHPFFTKVMKAHQYEGVKFMWDACFESLQHVGGGHPGGGCILAHCMGLGKTLQVLALLHTVLTHPRVGMQRVLVCCPLSTVLNWVDEIHKWIGPVTDQIKVFELSKLRKTYERAYQLEDWYNGGGIFIIGYELFRSLTTLDPLVDDVRPTIINKIRTALLDPGPDIIVCDEGHLLKNDCSVLAVAMSRVATRRRIVLTGTPMQNNLREYYCMVNFVKPNLLGTYSEYSNRFENPIMNGQHRDSREEDIKLMKARTHILHKVLEGCLQRQEASVLYPYLPKKHEYTVFIPLTKCQWDLYKHYLNRVGTGHQTKQSLLKDFHTLQKIWSHPQVLHNFLMKKETAPTKIEKLEDDLAQEDLAADIKPSETDVWWLQYLEGGNMLDSLDTSNKFVAVFRILDECVALDDKVLLFSTSLFTLDALEYFLKKYNHWSLGQEYYRLDGSVPAEVRQKWCREFNAENNLKTKLFLVSTRAGCLGLNMVAANRVILLDTSWNPAHDIQSIFRVYRFGQKKDCYIYRLVAMGTMEQKIYERSVTKQAVACRVIDEQQIDRHYNMAELTELYRFDELGSSVAGGVAVAVGDVALLRVARDSAIHAVHEHDSLLRGSSEHALPEHERAAAWMQFQQEHANKQIQNEDAEAKSKSKAKMIKRVVVPVPVPEPAPPVLEVKREPEDRHDAEYILPEAKNSTYRPEAKRSTYRSEAKKSVYLPEVKSSNYRPGPKSRKKRTPPAPTLLSTPETEEHIVHKITDILIQHQFHSRSDTTTSVLVSVRRILAGGQPGLGDELAASIARLLLESGVPVVPPPPPPLPPPYKRGRPKKNRGGRPIKTEAERFSERLLKRGVELAAQKLLEPPADDRSSEGTVSAPEQTPTDDDRLPTPVEAAKPPKKKIKTAQKAAAVVQESILLSDDEDPPSTPLPSPAAEKIPLHPTLLTNENFIKIVAHTYLEGNPMLDEDAATLAARYSTLKAYNDIKDTGNPMYSGPIFDIAVKVLGIEILEKLHKTSSVGGPTSVPKPGPSKSKEPTNITALRESLLNLATETIKKEPAKKQDAPVVKKEIETKRRKPGPLTQTRRELTNVKVTSGTTGTAAKPTKTVVIKRLNPPPAPAAAPAVPLTSPLLARLSAPATECILPDDEDVHIIMPPASEPVPVQIVPAAPVASRRLRFRRIAPAPPIASSEPAAAPAPLHAPAADATICLDSDDDEPPPPVPMQLTGPDGRTLPMPHPAPPAAPRPVPMSLTGPNGRTIPMPVPAAPSPLPRVGPAPSTRANSQIPMPQAGPAALAGPSAPMTLVSSALPMSLTDHMLYTGPSGSMAFVSSVFPMPFAGPTVYAIPASAATSGAPQFVIGPNGHTLTMTRSGHEGQAYPLTLTGPDGRAVPMSAAAPAPVPASPVVPMSAAAPAPVPASPVVPMTLIGPDGRAVQLRPEPKPLAAVRQAAEKSVKSVSERSTKSAPERKRTKQKEAPLTPPSKKKSNTEAQIDLTESQTSRSTPTSKLTSTPNPTPTTKPSLPPAAPGTVIHISKVGDVEVVELDSPPSPPAEPDAEDPLAIFKNVVHIQAPTAPLSPPTPGPRKLAAEVRKPTPEVRKPPQEVCKSTPEPRKPTSEVSKSTTMFRKTLPNLSTTPNMTRVKPKNKASDDVFVLEIDKRDSKPRAEKVVGTLRIILDAKSKSLTKTPSKTEQSQKLKMQPAAGTSAAPASAKKRPAPPPADTTKRKKISQMTLKDFDLDDIDDIIELE